MSYCVLKTNGRMIRLLKAPFETDEQAMDRAWWIANRKAVGSDGNDIAESLKWVYQKYLKVKY